MLQRLLVGVALVERGIRHIGEAPHTIDVILHLVGAVAGIFLLVGLWTPIFGTIVAIVEMSIAVFFHTRDPWMCVIFATLGATLAMIGPGAWSIDARLFGRRHFAD